MAEVENDNEDIRSSCDDNNEQEGEGEEESDTNGHSKVDCGNINKPNKFGATPLLQAIKNRNIETTCMLFYHGADVTITNFSNSTPLMAAICNHLPEIEEMLLKYYVDFDTADVDGYTALHYAAFCRSPILLNLLKEGANVNLITDDGQLALQSFAGYGCEDVFKLMWRKIDYKILLECQKPFLLTYVHCHFKTEWLKLLYEMLESPIASDLVQHCRGFGKYTGLESRKEHCDFFYLLLDSFYYKNVSFDNRMYVIYTCLSLGAEVYIQDVFLADQIYGFNEELEALIYTGNFKESSGRGSLGPTLYYILCLTVDFSNDYIFLLFQNFLRNSYRSIPCLKLQDIMYSLRFFSVPLDVKKKLSQSFQKWYKDVDLKTLNYQLSLVAEFPSLVELSRNAFYKFIRRSRNIEQAYQFHDIVKGLKLPQLLEDYVRFKRPIYG